MQLLEGLIRHYDWGSVDALPDFLGRPATGEPWAELWLGAHPSGPSAVGASGQTLDALIAADPDRALGADVVARFGGLPFLVKVLAAGAPLSLQAHPSKTDAETGFDRENEAGIPLDHPGRSFRDRNHKPELICALTEFEALCGFREPRATLAILETIDTPALTQVRTSIENDPNRVGLDTVIRHLLRLGKEDGAAVADEVVAACRADGPDLGRSERSMAVALGERYPGDVGVVTALLLNLVTLAPGEALFLGAGNLHMYLHGMGVEIMANSDNVLRGGLTSKHVDVDALLSVVDATPIEARIQRPPLIDGAATYDVPVAEFSLRRIEVDGEIGVGTGPAILLCTSGAVHAGAHVLDRGAAAWVSAEECSVTLSGLGTVFHAGVGALDG